MMRGDDWDGSPVAGTYASRKLNGVAMLWDGAEGWTRSGNLIPLPAHIRATLPAIPLDCEIISAKGGNADFSAASGAVRLNRWTPDIHAAAFDAPAMPGDWAERIEIARAAGATCVSWTVCKSPQDLLWMFNRITGEDGEGVMLRTPGKGYRAGRTRDLLKVKWTQHICELMDFQPYAVSPQKGMK
jgi:ATP-dependent DNA ligase